MPLSGALQPKRRWVPSKWEKQKVRGLVTSFDNEINSVI